MNPDIFLITGVIGVGMALSVVVYLLIGRAQRRATRDRVADARARVGLPAPAADNAPSADAAVQDALERLWDLPAYSGGDHTTTNPTGDQT